MADQTNSGSMQPPPGLDIDDLLAKMQEFFHRHYGARFNATDKGLAVQINDHPIDEHKLGTPHVLHVNESGHVQIAGQNQKEIDAQILATLHAAKDLWDGKCHIHDGDDAFARRVVELASQHGYNDLTITRGDQQQVLTIPAAPVPPDEPAQQFTRTAAETTVRPPRRPADIPPTVGVEEIKTFKEADSIVARHNADAAATKTAYPDRDAFHRGLKVVEVVDLNEHKKLMKLHERFQDKTFPDDKDKSFAGDLSDFLYDLKFKKNGDMHKKSQEQFAALGANYGPEIQNLLIPVLDKGFRYTDAYNKCFQLETEKVQTGALLAQLLVINANPELRDGDGADKKGIGWSREAVYYIQDKKTGEVVAGANHAAYGHNGGNSPSAPSTYGIFAFVVPKFQTMGIGPRNYNQSDALMLRDINALADGEVKAAIAKKGSIERFAEINDGKLMTLGEIAGDAAGSRVTPFERTSVLINKVGYREVDYKKVTGGARYYEPKYDIERLGKPNETSDGGTEYCGIFVAERKVRVADGPNGAKRLELAGERVPMKEVSIDTAIAQLKNGFEQTFDGAEDPNDRALNLIKALEAARSRGVKTVPTVDATTHLANNALWEKRYEAIKTLVGDKPLDSVQVAVAAGPGTKAIRANLGQEELEGAPATLPRERQRLSIQTLYEHGSMSVANVKKLGAVGKAVMAELEKQEGHEVKGQISLKTIIGTQIELAANAGAAPPPPANGGNRRGGPRAARTRSHG